MERCLAPFAGESGALLIGTDLPSLPDGALQRLQALLERRKIVLGPTLDGGYYAIGVRGAVPPIFRGIRWSSRLVFEETVRRLKGAGRSAAIGPVWHDIDRWSDLRLLCGYLSHLELKKEHPCPATERVLRRLGLLARRG